MMKKVLLASTALVVTSSFAAAQGVELSGYAEIGIADKGSSSDVEFHHDLDVTFSMSGETDNGLTFGATIDLDEIGDDCSSGGLSATTINGTGTTATVSTFTTSNFFSICTGGDGIGTGSGEHSVFVSGSFGTLTMGDTDGAFDFALSETGGLSSIADDHTTHAGYDGNGGLDGNNDGQILRYDHSFGDVDFALSAELDDGGSDDVIGVGVRWSADMGGTNVAVGLGYQDDGVVDISGISVRAGFGDVTAILNYTDHTVNGDYTAIGVTYTTGALSLHANYGERSGVSGTSKTCGVGSLSCDGFGLAANYDLGGGAVAMIGYGDDSTGLDQWSAGLGLSF